jgi:hypothetical protein
MLYFVAWWGTDSVLNYFLVTPYFKVHILATNWEFISVCISGLALKL